MQNEMNDTRKKRQIFLAFCQFLDKNKLPYVIVGDTSRYPESIDSDVDIVVSPDNFRRMQKVVVNFSRNENANLVQLLQHETVSQYFVLFWGENPCQHIALDICGDYIRNGTLLVCSDKLLHGRRIAEASHGSNKGFYICSPEMEFLYYMLKKAEKGSMNQRQLEHLKRQHDECAAGCLKQLHSYWSPELSLEIVNYVRDVDLPSFVRALPKLKAALVGTCHPNQKQWVLEFFRKASRVLHPTGLVVALMGPDGCGKSTIGDRLVVDIAPAFRGMKRFHLRPCFVGKGISGGSDSPVTDPHGKPPRSVLISLIKLVYLLADFIGGYWTVVRPLKVRSHLILFDRYYNDILIDPKRYRYGAPGWFARLVALFIPEPDIFLILDASEDVIRHRKQEVSLLELQRQRQAYLSFAAKRENCIVVNTDQELEDTLRQIRFAILDFMSNRLEKRMGITR